MDYDFTECFLCAYHKRNNQHIYKENVPHVNKFDPRYSDSLCADCIFLVDEDFDSNSMDRDEYLQKLFENRMAERTVPFAVWSEKPKLLKWYPMNDDATHWRCCTQTKGCFLFEDFHMTSMTPPPIKRQETDIILNKKNELN